MAYNYITKYDSPNYTPKERVKADYGMARVVEGITIHHWGDPANNPQFINIVNYLSRANGNTSAHYVATGSGRQVACIVSPDNAAWHGGTAWANARTIGIELDPRARDEDYDVAAELVADLRSAYGDVPIYWHSYFVATACPGKWSPERLDKLSYTKYSASAFGKGGTKPQNVPKPPVVVAPPVVKPPVVVKPPIVTLPVIPPVVVPEVPNLPPAPATPKQEVPSPTSNVPDTGVPVSNKPDYIEVITPKLTMFIKKLIEFIIGLLKGK
jgi:hypothetical protein